MARARKQVRRAAQAKPGKQGSPAAPAAQGDLVVTHRHAAGSSTMAERCEFPHAVHKQSYCPDQHF